GRRRAEAVGSTVSRLDRDAVLSGTAGAACVFGFAPFYAWPVPLLALAVLFALWRSAASPWRAALAGYAFGLGYFLVGTSWVYVSLHRYGAMPAPLAALATLLFCAYLALHPAAAGWIAVRFGRSSAALRLALMPPAIGTAASRIEWTRPDGAPVTVAMLQGNIPQEIKWIDEVRTKTLLDYRAQAFAANARVVVLPETALPAYLDQLPADYMQSLRGH